MYNNGLKNTPFSLQCNINTLTFKKLPKEIADDLIEIIEDAGEFGWSI